MRLKPPLPYLILVGITISALSAGAIVRPIRQDLLWINEPLHSTVEALGGLAAIAMAFVLFARRAEWHDEKAQLVAIGFLGMGLLEGFHAVSQPGDGFVLLRSSASLLGGLGFSLVWLPATENHGRMCGRVARIIAAGASALGLWALAFPERLPQMTLHGEFSPAAIAMNSVAAILFLTGSAGFLADFRRTGRLESYLFACLALLFGIAEIMFHYSAPWDSGWWFWHLLRLLAYALVLGYVSRGYALMVADLRSALVQTQRSERRLAAQYAVTRVLAESSTLKEASVKILQAIGESLDWELAMLWSTEGQGATLRCIDLWHAPWVEAAEFVKDSSQRAFPRGVGLPGRVWASGAPAWIPDVLKDEHFPRAPFAARVGLHGAFAFPIRSGDTTHGVLEFFSHEIREPDRDLLDMVADIGIKIGQFVERKRTETELRETEAKLLEEARLAEVARVLADIGHDLKNLLTPVVMGTRILEEELNDCENKLPNLDPEKAKGTLAQSKDVIAMMRNGTRRIHDRVKEIADSVKGLSTPPQFGPCRVADIVSGVFETLRLLADQQGVALRAQNLAALPPIQADESRLFNAFYNLVNNAIPEVPAGGAVTVSGYADITMKTVTLSVADTGRGMPPEVCDSLFTYQAISRKGGGTGLGTKIVKDVVDAHGGRITVESKEGVGTAFHIILPTDGPTLPLPPMTGRATQ